MSTLPLELVARAEPLPPQAEDLRSRAQSLQIRDQLGYEAAGHLLLTVQSMLKEAEDMFREPKANAAQTHKSICALEAKVTEPLTKARNFLKDKMSGYIAWQMEQVELANRAAREEAAAQHAREIEAQLEEAETRGASIAEVQAIIEQPSELPRPVRMPVQPVRGVSTREDWSAEITDLRAFLEAALRNPTLFSVVKVDAGKLNQLARVLKGTLRDIPGLRVMHKPAIAASRQGGMYQ